MAALSHAECWDLADRERPGDPGARKDRYIALLKQHGHVIDRPVGEGHTGGIPNVWGGRR